MGLSSSWNASSSVMISSTRWLISPRVENDATRCWVAKVSSKVV